MNLGEFHAVILDMDGVITQTAQVHARAWKILFDEFLKNREGESQEPFDIGQDYPQYVDGIPRYEGVKSFLESRGIDLPYGNEEDEPDQQTICGLGNRKNQIFHELLKHEGVQVYEDTIAQIGNWKQAGLKVGVITSSRNGEAVLKAAQVRDLFDVKVDGNDLARENLQGKPAPDIFWHAAKQLEVEPEQTIVVEDAIAGVQAGRAGGFGWVVGVARGQQADELRRAGADVVVHDLRDLETAHHNSSGGESRPTPKSALEHFDRIATRIHSTELALFLDYDGTLTPIVRRPEEATLSESMRSVISDLARQGTVAIVSGRDRQNVEQMVQLPNLIYAGSHGFDIHGPGGLDLQQEEAQQAIPALDEAEQQLRQQVDSIPGANVERKRYAIAVHYREVTNEEDVQKIENVVNEMISQHPTLRKRGGKKIFELQPDVEWDKGQAVLWIREALGLDHPGVTLIYIGDDVTDEDAFEVLRSLGQGIGIRVAQPLSGTDAAYYLLDTDTVETFLKRLFQFLQENHVENHD